LAITAATTPLSLCLGLGGADPWPAITPMTVSRNGNALCLARRFLEQGVSDRQTLARALTRRERPLRIGVPQSRGIAEILLRHWLAAGGIDADRQVRFSALSPMGMEAALTATKSAPARASSPAFAAVIPPRLLALFTVPLTIFVSRFVAAATVS
jgi:ABC-type nitrate/sulfonate/bicarbonate transport system substrate-binding protein